MEPKEAHLVFAANRQALMPLMMKKLLEGTHLVVDRYAYSGIAYTLAKGILTVFVFTIISREFCNIWIVSLIKSINQINKIFLEKFHALFIIVLYCG